MAAYSGAEHRRRKREQRERFIKGMRICIGLLFTVVTMSAPWWLNSGSCAQYTQKLTLLSVRLQTPMTEQVEDLSAGQAAEAETVEPTTAVTTTTAAPTTTTTAATTAAQSDDKLLPIKELKLGATGLVSGNVSVKNGTNYKINIDSVLKERPDCKIKLNAGYQVLIIHTHTTECYASSDSGSYDPNISPRTTDKSLNVIAVGDVLASKLEAAGIRTLHVTTAHDYPKYNGSYDRALETIESYLKQHPSIEMVIDVHRDAMTQTDGTKLKPTVTINGKKAAQVMIITGCDADGTLHFPEWRSNLRMAMQIQKQVADTHEGLMRPLYFAPFRYNMHMTPNSLLLEFGTDANTLAEAKYSAELVGDELVKVLKRYVVE